MVVLPVPNCCIWCHKKGADITFDISHVVPECIGNEQQTLPKGIVCKHCNQYFGSKVEPALLSDPWFHVRAVFLRLKDPEDRNDFRDRLFDASHTSVEPVQRNLNIEAAIRELEISLAVKDEIQGRLMKKYTYGQLALLSRAVHKIAFESLAWVLYVKGIDESIDLFSSDFDHVRKWAREGQPLNHVRLVLRRPSNTISPQWKSQLWKFGKMLAIELNLFGDWYVVSLTSSPSDALNDLRARANMIANIWCMTDRFFPLQ
jgi:hypothetical protein